MQVPLVTIVFIVEGSGLFGFSQISLRNTQFSGPRALTREEQLWCERCGRRTAECADDANLLDSCKADNAVLNILDW